MCVSNCVVEEPHEMHEDAAGVTWANGYAPLCVPVRYAPERARLLGVLEARDGGTVGRVLGVLRGLAGEIVRERVER